MARQQILRGVLILTVTVLLNTRLAEAVNCADDTDCKNGGTCPDTSAPCDCSASSYVGDTCETEVCTDVGSECQNGGTCVTAGTPNVCLCGEYKGKTCADECTDDAHCGTDGKCETGPPRTCTCTDETKEGPGCTKDKSGASAVTGFSLTSLFVVLTGYLL